MGVVAFFHQRGRFLRMQVVCRVLRKDFIPPVPADEPTSPSMKKSMKKDEDEEPAEVSSESEAAPKKVMKAAMKKAAAVGEIWEEVGILVPHLGIFSVVCPGRDFECWRWVAEARLGYVARLRLRSDLHARKISLDSERFRKTLAAELDVAGGGQLPSPGML